MVLPERVNLKKSTPQSEVEWIERVILVSLQLSGSSAEQIEASLDELGRLISALGGEVADRIIQKRTRPAPGMYIGKGKAREIGQAVKSSGATLVAFDQELTGTQQKNLETEIQCRIIDRTGVILDIFSKHARTKESKNQVELASLEYLATHLTRRWTHLERQKGGIGLRGVGEKQIELDRRMIRSRISRLKQQLQHTERDRAVQRQHRDRYLRVALVGYTNAGKSTVMNGLTTAEVLVDNRVFATLDSTVRALDPHTRPPILLSDTVGFIDKLPHSLVASFRSTLQEVLEADLLLHVVDLSSLFYHEQMKITQDVLEEIGAGDKPTALVFNKSDQVSEGYLPKIVSRRYVDSMVVSAQNPDDMVRLRDFLYRYFEREMVELELTISYRNTWLQSQIHEYSKILKKDYLAEGAHFRIRIMRSAASYLKLTEHGAVPVTI